MVKWKTTGGKLSHHRGCLAPSYPKADSVHLQKKEILIQKF